MIKNFRASSLFTILLLAAAFLCAISLISAADPDEPASQPRSFDDLYSMRDDEIIKWVHPPFPPERLALYQKTYFSKDAAEAPPAMIINLRIGKLEAGGWSHDPNGHSLGQIIGSMFYENPDDIEGDRSLLALRLKGDFIRRSEATPDQLRAALESIAGEAIGGKVSVAFRQVQRRVLIIKGEWTGAIPRPGVDTVEFYGNDLNKEPTNTTNSGAGPVKGLAEGLGLWLHKAVIVEATGGPPFIRWHGNEAEDVSSESHIHAHDPDLVLKHFQEQTGLTCSEETREVRRLFVEPVK